MTKFLSWAIALIIIPYLSPVPILAAELEEIIDRGKLIVAIKDNIRPLGFYGDKDNLQGLEIDIAKRLAEELLGNPDAVILEPVNNQERLQVVLDGKVDIAIARISFTPSRSRLIDLSNYYYLDGTGLITQDSSIQQLEDLTTRKIALLHNSSTIAVIRSVLPQAQLIGVNSYTEGLNLLETGKADAFAADNTVLTGWVQEYPAYHQLPIRLSGEALCIAIPKGLQYVSLRNRINSAIARWHKSGWLRERTTYWGLP